jgi:hypothetical protein
MCFCVIAAQAHYFLPSVVRYSRSGICGKTMSFRHISQKP